MTHAQHARSSFAIIAALAFASLASGCGAGSRAQAPNGQVLAVIEADFALHAPATAHSGDVAFRVINAGPDQHELIVARAGRGPLPLRADGITVDEEALAHAEVGSLQPAQPGPTRELTVSLRPGRYVLFCNMTGHYMGGMHSTLVVN